MFSSEKISASALKPGVAVLAEDTAGAALLYLGRNHVLWESPDRQVEFV